MRLMLEAVVGGVLVPAGVAVLLLLLGRRFRREEGVTAAAAGAAGAAAGFVAGYAAFEWAPLTPTDRWHWLPYLAIAAALAGIGAFALPRAAGRIGLALLLAALAAWVLVPMWSDLEPVRPRWLTGIGASVFLLWMLLDPLAGRGPATFLFLMLSVVTAAGSVVLFLASSAKFAHLAGVLAAVLGAFALVSWWRPSATAARAAVPVFAVLLPGRLFDGHLYTYSEVPLVSFLLVAAAPLMLWIGDLPWVRNQGFWQRLAVQAFAVLVPLGVAVALAVVAQADTF